MAQSFDINKLTLGELAQIEELSGQSVSAMADTNAPKARLFTAMAFIARKRVEPDFTINAAEALTMEDLNSILGFDVAGAESPAEAPSGE